MKKHSFKGQYTDTVSITGSKADWVLEKNASIEATEESQDSGIYESAERHDNRLIISGDIKASLYGLDLRGTNTEVVINQSAEIEASHPVLLFGIDQDLTNNGTLIAYGTGIILNGTDNTVHNNNHIEGATTGISISGLGGSQIFNAKGATILGGSVGVSVESGGNTSRTTNHGTIQGTDSWGYEGGNGDDRLINDGSITGGVYLGGGNDTADMRGTKGSYNIFGSNGNDILLTDNTNIKLFEFSGDGTGYDTVKSTVTYTLATNVEQLILLGGKEVDGTGNASANVMTGNAGDNVLMGLEGTDAFDGGAGNDTLYGGADQDTFYFAKGGDHDVVMDYEPGHDYISFEDLKAIKNYNDLMDNHVFEKNGDVIIKAGDDWLTLKDTTAANLAEAYFGFAD